MRDYNIYREKIEKFWDINAHVRANDIESGNDKTYVEVISCYIVKRIKKLFQNPDLSILDIGCGEGYLTNKISEYYKNITGIDLSKAFISYACNRYPHIKFLHEDIYRLSDCEKYDLCLATMVVHNLPHFSDFFTKTVSLLKEGGYLLLTTLHPNNWPRERIPNFLYEKNDEEYEVPLRGSSDCKYSSSLNYFHRTLEAYLNPENFQIIKYYELYGYEDDSENRKRRKEPNILVILLQSKL
ncbi:MAG: class I SAM-dependent methyltransferase [Candidatus Cloacimonetes bacterium]|nr:class I SAM-dependent methyltransferase [Candidatus Cloacimonadota bacterium]